MIHYGSGTYKKRMKYKYIDERNIRVCKLFKLRTFDGKYQRLK